LLKAVEASKSSARDAARAAQTEARLRGEVSDLRTERDTVIGELAEARRKVGLMEEEVRLLKSRIAKLTQEKIKVERDARAALSLARSMDSHAADDVEYYKRRVRRMIMIRIVVYRINF
jgi:chromosome segregation ATPase